MSLTDPQRLLLVAACAAGEDALPAWRAWTAGADLDRLTPGDYALFPLAYRNLEPHAPADGPFRKVSAIYRRTWLANQLVLRKAAELGTALESRGIDYALAGDAALALAAYPDAGARVIAGLDFLVGPDRLREAAEAAAGLAREADDIRWHVQLLPGVTGRFSASLLSAAAPTPVAGASIRVLAPADLFLVSCERLCSLDSGPAAPALADAWRLLGTLSSADWERVQDQAEQERATLTLATVLGQLQALGANPPPWRCAPPGLLERLEFHLKGRTWEIPGRSKSLMVLRHLKAWVARPRERRARNVTNSPG